MRSDVDRRRSLLTAALGVALLDTRRKPARPEVRTVRNRFAGGGNVTAARGIGLESRVFRRRLALLALMLGLLARVAWAQPSDAPARVTDVAVQAVDDTVTVSIATAGAPK